MLDTMQLLNCFPHATLCPQGLRSNSVSSERPLVLFFTCPGSAGFSRCGSQWDRIPLRSGACGFKIPPSPCCPAPCRSAVHGFAELEMLMAYK